MNTREYIEMGLNGDAPLKVIMGGSVVSDNNEKVGVVSLVFATMDKSKAKEVIDNLTQSNSNESEYYMVYSVPLDTDLSKLDHYPSIAISKNDLK